MSKTIRIRKGADIKLLGTAERKTTEAAVPSSVAIKPADFHGMVPKMIVKEGAEVQAGTPIFFDKENEHVMYVSPVSGEIAAIVRGAKRRILEVRIVADRKNSTVTHTPVNLASADGDQVKAQMLEVGLWPLIKQRPYDVVADPKRKPKAIFISAFDSSPLAPDFDYILQNDAEACQKGIEALAKLSGGKVYVGVRSGQKSPLAKAKGVVVNEFNGPHPAGNVGVQIHHISPVSKGESVWCVGAQAVAIIGRFFLTGKVSFEKTIALAGSEVKEPRYVKTLAGASIKSIVEGSLKEGDNRIISGNVLTGTKVDMDGYLGFYDDVISVIPEGREPQFMGWLAPNFHKKSFSRSYFSWLSPGKNYRLNTNQNGEDRAFVVTGQYEDLLPMDIYPVYLLKAIMTNDIEKMEGLGIYEVAPEDMALCEFACTSKIEVQHILRSGLDLAKQELG